MEEQYIEPTTGGRLRALVPVAVYLLGSALTYWLAVIIAQRHEAELAKYTTAEDYLVIASVVGQQLLEGAWLRLLIWLAIAGHIFWMTRAIQMACQCPISNRPFLTPVMF